MFDILRKFHRLARKQFFELVEEMAVLMLVDVVEHPQNIVATLKEEKVQYSESAQSERLGVFLTFKVDTDLSQIPRLVH